MYEEMQWLVVTMAADEVAWFVCLWMSIGEFDSNLAELKSKFDKIFKNKVIQLGNAIVAQTWEVM